MKVYAFVKRVIEFFGALAGFFALLPLFFLLAVLIKLDSPGPVLFLQQRLTKGKRGFTIFKFRSMAHRWKEKHLSSEQATSSRGHFLRDTHLDELPQLINVVVGDMSLVGPRPVAEVWLQNPKFKHPMTEERFKVRAGMTSIERLLEYDIDIEEKQKILSLLPEFAHRDEMPDPVVINAYYVRNECLLLDAKILYYTFKHVFHEIMKPRPAKV